MNIDELESFSVNELTYLSIKELELEANKLSEKLLKDNRELPPSIIVKLQEICTLLPDDAPKIKEGMTKSEICMFLTLIITYLNGIPEISKKWSPIIQSVIETISSCLL